MIDCSSRMGASREEIAAEAAETHAAFARVDADIKGSQELAQVFDTQISSSPQHANNSLQKLKNSLFIRKDRWLKFRALISSKAKAQFTYLLAERSFQGRLLADHGAKLLDVQVKSRLSVICISGFG